MSCSITTSRRSATTQRCCRWWTWPKPPRFESEVSACEPEPEPRHKFCGEKMRTEDGHYGDGRRIEIDDRNGWNNDKKSSRVCVKLDQTGFGRVPRSLNSWDFMRYGGGWDILVFHRLVGWMYIRGPWEGFWNHGELGWQLEPAGRRAIFAVSSTTTAATSRTQKLRPDAAGAPGMFGWYGWS